MRRDSQEEGSECLLSHKEAGRPGSKHPCCIYKGQTPSRTGSRDRWTRRPQEHGLPSTHRALEGSAEFYKDCEKRCPTIRPLMKGLVGHEDRMQDNSTVFLRTQGSLKEDRKGRSRIRRSNTRRTAEETTARTKRGKPLRKDYPP